jgi:hypothetical protein
MANYETPDRKTDGYVVPEDIDAELSSALYGRVADRLFCLNIVTGRSPTSPDVFSRPIDNERSVSVVAFGQPVIDSSGVPIVTQRLIVNTRQRDERTGLPRITVDDFVIDHNDETISYKRSEIPSKPVAFGAQILVNSQTAPYINFECWDVEVIFGKDYELHHFDEDNFTPKNLVAEDALLGTLNILSEDDREPVAECRYRLC